jgi:hypothetical protein
VPLTDSRQNSATSAPAGARSLSELLDELGREAWRIRQRERAARAEIEASRAIEETHPGRTKRMHDALLGDSMYERRNYAPDMKSADLRPWAQVSPVSLP